MKLYPSKKYTFTLSSYTLSEATASKYTFTLISYTFTLASKYTFTVRLTSDEDDILMMEGRGDFAARKKKTLTDNHTNIIQQPYITSL